MTILTLEEFRAQIKAELMTLESDIDDAPIAPVVTDPPDSIWLVYGDLADDASHRECCESGEVTWCDHAVFGSDVRYVREDIVNKLLLEIEQLTELAWLLMSSNVQGME